MNTETSATTNSASAHASVLAAAQSAAQDARIPAAQRAVLLRIAAQRARLRARHSAHVQALALRRQQTAQSVGGATLPERLLAFAYQHPVAVATAAAAVLALGPGRLMRWSNTLLPLLLRFRR